MYSPFCWMRNAYYHFLGPSIVMGVLLTAIAGRSELAGQALNQFLADQIAPEVHEFGEIRITRADISQWLQRLRTAKQPQERGVAVANLQNCAWVLLDTPETRPVALELLDRWVIPNATSCELSREPVPALGRMSSWAPMLATKSR